jgi:hypothetical protein
MLFKKSHTKYGNYINQLSDEWALRNTLAVESTKEKFIKFRSREYRFLFSEHFKNCNFNSINEKLILNRDLNSIAHEQDLLIFIVNNSDYARNADVFKSLQKKDNIIFAVWDWDNNHWINNSIEIAKRFDIYIPFSLVNGYCLSNFSRFFLHPVELGSNQWKKQFLRESQKLILNFPRSEGSISGGFSYYPEFRLRNEIITTLGKIYNHIEFTKNFHSLTDVERLYSYLQCTAQLVVPIYDGFPNRFFDVLITGGIPVVPPLLKYHAKLQSIDRCVVFKEWNKSSIDEAIFNALQMHRNQPLSEESLFEAIELHHIDNKKEKIVSQIKKLIG